MNGLFSGGDTWLPAISGSKAVGSSVRFQLVSNTNYRLYCSTCSVKRVLLCQ